MPSQLKVTAGAVLEKAKWSGGFSPGPVRSRLRCFLAPFSADSMPRAPTEAGDGDALGVARWAGENVGRGAAVGCGARVPRAGVGLGTAAVVGAGVVRPNGVAAGVCVATDV
jgi:hypothetical protein